MKRYFRLLLILLLLLSLLSPLSVQAYYPKEQENVKISAYDTMKITKKNNSNYNFAYPKGILKNRVHGDYGNGNYWVEVDSLRRVFYSGQKFIVTVPGKWIKVQLTVYTDTKPNINNNNDLYKAKITVDKAPIHEIDIPNSKILGYAKKGSKVTIIDSSSYGWYLIKKGSTFGWIRFNDVAFNMRVKHNNTPMHWDTDPGQYDVLAKIKANTIIKVLLKKGDWYRINTGNLDSGSYKSVDGFYWGSKSYGWIHKKYLSSNLNLSTLDKGTVTSNTINVYSSNDTCSEVIGQLKKDREVSIVYSTKNWYKIKYKNRTTYAWVLKKHIKKL